MTPFDAIVLAGGESTRLGTDKTRLSVHGMPVLERVLAAVSDAEARLVVGPARPISDDTGVRWLREEPPGSGPANGVACAAPHVSAEVAVVLAGDLPYIAEATIRRMLDAVGDGPGTVLTDASDRPQWLTAAVRTAVLRRQLRTRASWDGAAMHTLLRPLDLTGVAAHGDESHDIDRPEDIPSGHESPAVDRPGT